MPDYVKSIVLIDEVDTKNLQVHVVDTNNGRFIVPYGTASNGHLTFPNSGEKWYIVRTGTQWFLDARFESGTETVAATDLEAGDTRIGIGGTLHLDAANLELNKKAMGVMHWDRFTIPADGSWNVQLSYPPVDLKTVLLFNNGTVVDPSYLSLTNATLSGQPLIKFSPGTLLVYYQYTP